MLAFAASSSALNLLAFPMTSSRISLVLLALLIAMVSFYLWPTLGGQWFFGYADNAIHGLPLVELHSRILNAGESALWSPLIYGGHPLFAETQGAFANPVNILLTWLLPPVLVSSLLHWVGLAMGASGMFALGRVMGLSPWASAFAAIAAVFSPFWLGINANMTVTAAVGWVPWALWAFEVWLKRLDVPSAIVFAIMTTMLLLPGYPHLLLASVLYMVVSLLPSLLNPVPLFKPVQRHNQLAQHRALIATGTLAVILTSGLAAVQLLPLVELIEQSHRSESIKLGWFALPELYYRGFFFALDDKIESASVLMLPSISSLMVCVLAAGGALWRPSMRFVGVLLAAFLLGNLALGYASSIFNFVYEHNLVPGIRKFRVTHPFFLPALIGITLLAGAALDGLTDRLRSYCERSKTLPMTLLTLVPGLAAALAMAWFGISLFQAPLSRIFLLTTAAVFVTIAVAATSRRPQWLAPAMLAVLVFEIFQLKFYTPHFSHAQQLQTPAAVQHIAANERRDYKFLDLADTAACGLKPTSPRIDIWFQRALTAVAPSTNLLWDVPSIGGAFALNLRRHTLVEVHLRSESAGDIKQAPGLRLIDLLGLRYITAHTVLPTAGFTLQRQDAANSLYFYRNDFAMPRFQHYNHALAVDDMHGAFEHMKRLQQRTLVVEANKQTLADIGAAPSLAGTAAASSDSNGTFRFNATQARSDYYAFDVATTQGGWLFVADNMYPGWSATLDGKPMPLFAAQVMGKAVWVPAGNHQVEIRFVSRSFQIGLAITLVTLALIVFLLVVIWRRKHLHTTARNI